MLYIVLNPFVLVQMIGFSVFVFLHGSPMSRLFVHCERLSLHVRRLGVLGVDLICLLLFRSLSYSGNETDFQVEGPDLKFRV